MEDVIITFVLFNLVLISGKITCDFTRSILIYNSMEVKTEVIYEWLKMHVQSASYRESKHAPSTKHVKVEELVELLKEDLENKE